MIKALVVFTCAAALIVLPMIFLMRIPERDIPPGSSIGE